MLNHITIMGRLTRDPELRRTGSGVAVTSFTVACDRDYSAKDAEKRETDFIDCVAWRQTGEFVSKYFAKGNMIVVSGRLQIREWTDKEGNKRRTAEILVDNAYFGESKRDNAGGNNTGAYSAPAPTYGGAPSPAYAGAPAPAQNPGYAQPAAPNGYAGYAPQAPASDFAMLEDDDAQLPF